MQRKCLGQNICIKEYFDSSVGRLEDSSGLYLLPTSSVRTYGVLPVCIWGAHIEDRGQMYIKSAARVHHFMHQVGITSLSYDEEQAKAILYRYSKSYPVRGMHDRVVLIQAN